METTELSNGRFLFKFECYTHYLTSCDLYAIACHLESKNGYLPGEKVNFENLIKDFLTNFGSSGITESIQKNNNKHHDKVIAYLKYHFPKMNVAGDLEETKNNYKFYVRRKNIEFSY